MTETGALKVERQQREGLADRGRGRRDVGGERAQLAEGAGDPRQPEAEQVGERSALDSRQRAARGGDALQRAFAQAAGAAVDLDDPGEVAREGAAVELPRGVDPGDAAAERVPAEDHAVRSRASAAASARCSARRLDDGVEIVERDLQPHSPT